MKIVTPVTVSVGDIVIGRPVQVPGLTPLFKLPLGKEYVVVYRVDSLDFTITGILDIDNIPDVTVDLIAQHAHQSLENISIAAGENYQNVNLYSGLQTVLSGVGDEVEGIKKYGNYIDVATRNSDFGRLSRYQNGSLVTELTFSKLHTGGFLRWGSKYIVPVSGSSADSDTDIYLINTDTFDRTLVASLDGVHLGNVVQLSKRFAILGNWDTLQLYLLDIENGTIHRMYTSPSFLNYIQDADRIAHGDKYYYIGVYQTKEAKTSALEIFSFDERTFTKITGVAAAAPDLLANGIAVDGSVLLSGRRGDVFQAKPFIPIIGARVSSGDRYNIGIATSWPWLDSNTELWGITVAGGEARIRRCATELSSYEESDTVTAENDMIAYFWGSKSFLLLSSTLVSAELGLPRGALAFGAQTWGSATQDFSGSVYLIMAVPFIIVDDRQFIIGAAKSLSVTARFTYSVRVAKRGIDGILRLVIRDYNNNPVVDEKVELTDPVYEKEIELDPPSNNGTVTVEAINDITGATDDTVSTSVTKVSAQPATQKTSNWLPILIGFAIALLILLSFKQPSKSSR